MPEIRQRLVFGVAACGAAIFGVLGVHGFGQAASPARTLIAGAGTPTAIQSGISPLTMRAPGSPEELRRRSIRPAAGGPIDRIGRSGATYVAGRVIVKFKDGVSPAAKSSAMSSASRSAAMSARPDYANFDIVTIDPSEDAEAVAQAFSARGDVEYAQAAYRLRPQFVPNDGFYKEQWNFPLIDLERAWDIQPQAGSAITVAVVDTGVAYTNTSMRFHANAFRVDSEGATEPVSGSGTLYPALGDLTLPFVAATELGPASRFVAPHDFIWNDATPVDLDGHGTHVSGTVGQLTNNGTNGTGDTANHGGTAGVAFNVKIMPVKVIDSDWDDIFGSPNQGTDDVVARGVRYAADNGAQIINMSIGRPGDSAPVLEDAIKYAVGKGAFVVVAAGNDFLSGNGTQEPAEIASRVPGAVSVGAVDRYKGHASYSSTGKWVELAAPGGDFGPEGTLPAQNGILQQTLFLEVVDTFQLPVAQFTAPRFDALAYYYFTGTSMAAPHVSGVAAMMMQQGITNPAAIEAALEQFAVPCSEAQNTCAASIPANRNNTYGFGLIEARNALRGMGLAR